MLLDLDPAVMDAVLAVVNAHLDENRSFSNPAVLDDILELVRNFDPTDDIIDKVEKLCLEVNNNNNNNKQGGDEQGSCGPPEPEPETETEGVKKNEHGGGEGSQVQIAASVRDHGPSDLNPAILDEIRSAGLDPAIFGEILKSGPSILDRIRIQNAAGLPAGECWTYLRTGACKNRSTCKFKHPPRTKDKQVSKDKGKEKEAEKPVRTESKYPYDKTPQLMLQATAASIHAPAPVAALMAMYQHFKSGGTTKLPEPISSHLGGGDDGVPLPPTDHHHHLPDRPAPLDLDPLLPSNCSDESQNFNNNPAVLDATSKLINALLDDENRNFNSNPAVLDAILKLIVDKVDNLGLEENKQEEAGGGSCCNRREAETENSVVDDYPVRPEAEDCSFSLKTGSCKFGSNCKINHPEEREECAENPSQTECMFYLRPGGCKYGAACGYSHGREKPSVAPVTDTNFAGLPIRPGERECKYYMRHGECKYGSNCRFSHPDPVAEGVSDPSSGYDKGGPALQGASETTAAPWSAPRSMSETSLYTTMMIPPSQGVSSQNAEWNGYQSPARSIPTHPPYVMDNSVTETSIFTQYPYRNQVEEFPERPGQPVCSYFLRTGDCKFKYSCKYHHPKVQAAGSPSYTFSDKGLL